MTCVLSGAIDLSVHEEGQTDKQTVSQEVGAGKRCDRVKVSAAVEAGYPLWPWHRALGEWGGVWLGGGWQQDRSGG